MRLVLVFEFQNSSSKKKKKKHSNGTPLHFHLRVKTTHQLVGLLSSFTVSNYPIIWSDRLWRYFENTFEIVQSLHLPANCERGPVLMKARTSHCGLIFHALHDGIGANRRFFCRLRRI